MRQREGEDTAGGGRDANEDEDGVWTEWDEEQRVLEDAEKFQEISVVGFMDEEQEQQEQVRTAAAKSRNRSRKAATRMG